MKRTITIEINTEDNKPPIYISGADGTGASYNYKGNEDFVFDVVYALEDYLMFWDRNFMDECENFYYEIERKG